MTDRGRRRAARVGAWVAVVAAIVVTVAVLMGSPDPAPSVADRAGSLTTTTSPATSADSTVPSVPATPNTAPRDAGIESLELRVISTVDHDPGSFTQGLVFGPDGRLYESAGRYGESDVREISPETGQVIREVPLPPDVFAEGLAIGPDGLVQLSWKEGRAFRWELDDLESLGEWQYEGEGWGLTHDAARQRFLRSDGSGVITLHDDETFEAVGRIEVTRAGEPVDELNELELVDGALYANVWKSTEILRIDPDSGTVTGVIDASIITPALADPDAVLNGIAHRRGDPANRLVLTGKDWPAMYVVDVMTR